MFSRLLFAGLLGLAGMRGVNGQCYTFSSGKAASLTVNLPNLPAMTMGAGGVTQYLLTNANSVGDSITLTLGQSAYPFVPAPSQVGIAGGISYAYLPFSGGTDFTEFAISLALTGPVPPNVPASVALELGGFGNLLPNGLPANFPPLSEWSINPVLIVSLPSGIPESLPVDSITSCSGSTGATPLVAAGGVLNAASFAKLSSGLGSPVSPGSLVAIFGSNLGTAEAHAGGTSFSNNLGGVSVTFNGVTAPLRDVLPSGPYPSINAQVPFEASGPQSVVVTVNNVSSSAETTQIVAQAPGIFTIPSGIGAAVLVNQSDGSIAAPAGSIPGLPSHPIAVGQAAYFYATGLGAMSPAVADGTDGGASGGTVHNVAGMPTVLVDSIPVTPVFAGQAPYYPGVYQVNIVIPKGAHSGTVNLQIQSADGTVTSATGISTITIQ
jgi:uncharacterized protein (TIGR03437 family)